MNKIEELLALADKATPGEWQYSKITGSKFDVFSELTGDVVCRAKPLRTPRATLSRETADNAAFIAAAANFIRSDEFKALVKDAERYRWLRDEAPDEWDVSCWIHDDLQELFSGEYIDEAIDKAMEAKP